MRPQQRPARHCSPPVGRARVREPLAPGKEPSTRVGRAARGAGNAQ